MIQGWDMQIFSLKGQIVYILNFVRGRIKDKLIKKEKKKHIFNPEILGKTGRRAKFG